MAITIGQYSFEGPYTNTESLKNLSGVYSILCKSNGNYNLVDVGESATVKSRVEDHDRKPCWQRNCSSNLVVAVLYTSNRERIEQEIRNQYKLPCGKK